MAAIAFTAVRKTFRRAGVDFPALDRVDLAIAEEEFVAVVGPSGCGKTTCLRLAAGFEFPTEGSVSVDGRRIEGPGPDRAVVFQQFALFPWKTVFDNIALGLRNKGVAKEERRDRIEKAIALMNLQGTRAPFRTSSRAACSSASRSRARMCSSPRSCSWTSRSARSTRRPA
jgi:NitT/TauT family transport system ATP-binding protein